MDPADHAGGGHRTVGLRELKGCPTGRPNRSALNHSRNTPRSSRCCWGVISKEPAIARGRISTAGVSSTGPPAVASGVQVSRRTRPPRLPRRRTRVEPSAAAAATSCQPRPRPGDRAHDGGARRVDRRAAGITDPHWAVEPEDLSAEAVGTAVLMIVDRAAPSSPSTKSASSAWRSRSASPCSGWPTRSGTSPAATSTRRSRWASGSAARSRWRGPFGTGSPS